MMFRTIPQHRHTTSITSAAVGDSGRCVTHHAANNGSSTAMPGLSQNASCQLPCAMATAARCIPQNGHCRWVSWYSGQGSMIM